MSLTVITHKTENESTLSGVAKGLQGNYEIVAKMVELVRNTAHYDKGFEQFTKKLLAENGFDSYSDTPKLFNFLYSYVNKSIRYIKDAAGNVEQLKSARQTLSDGYGDCDDQSVLIASMLAVLGFNPYFVLARYDVSAESYAHIYVAVYENGQRFVFDTTLVKGKLNKELKTVATKEIDIFGVVANLDGIKGFANQSKQLVKDIAKSTLQATPTALSFLPFGFGYLATHTLNGAAGMLQGAFASVQSYADLATAINRQLDSILVRLHKGEITLEEAKSYARTQAARLSVANLDENYRQVSRIDKSTIDKSVANKLNNILNFESIALQNGLQTFHLDTNKMLLAGLAVAGVGLYFVLNKD